MLNKLEKKFGKYAINNLIVYLLLAYLVGYMFIFGAKYTDLNLLSYATLNPGLIIHSFQIWRLITWVIVPPQSNIIVAAIMFLLYYQLGSVLERSWGAFRFNIYIFGGMLLTVIGAFVMYGILIALGANWELAGSYVSSQISTYYINLSIFLAFATCFPNMEVLLYFIIPVKMKWMAIVYVVIVASEIFTSINSGYWYAAIPIVASLLNFVIFYALTRNYRRISPKEIHRRNEFKRQAAPPPTQYRDGTPIARHRCAVCGRTEITNPEMDFRFCSKCNGNYEYCSEHLFTHKHIM